MAGQPNTGQLTPLQNAVYLLKQSQAKLAAVEQAQAEPIAIIGMGCRFPGGADSPQALWRLLVGGVDAIGEVPHDRWNVDEFYDPDPMAPSKMSTRWGGFLEHVDQFDADFFGISPREAVRIDPQHRLLLEVTWEALEDAGLPPGDIAQTKTGVYVGVIGNDYALLQSKDLSDVDVFSGTGSSHSILANRLSYVLNLNGPSIALDTACSSSLVTVHLACQSLRRRETDMALAGGVNLIMSPEMTITLSKAHMMAPDGRCKTFDATANGYVRGEGCGMIVLKRLSDALADGDRILALVRGSAVNHDGRSNGLSAPNGPAQEAVIRAALADGRLPPAAISYIEAHGTGTRLGDPIEIEALRSVLLGGRPADRPLMVGSLKTNIGHLESAAGIAGLIKLVLMLQHQQIPAHLHLHTINPLLKLDEVPLQIPTTLVEWPRHGQPLRAGVSSFGFGGTNGHVIVEEAPQEAAAVNGETSPAAPAAIVERPRHVFTLSARSPQALSELAGRYAAQAEDQPAEALADLAFTANTGRTHFNHRAALVVSSIDELRNRLQALAADPAESGVYTGEVHGDRRPRVAFLFTGQGAQYGGMARGLYQTQPVFRAAINDCAEILRPLLDRPLDWLMSPEAGSVLDQTGNTQPVMFAVEYALARLWQNWGVHPSAVMGHSVGEFAAACIAGVMSLEDGLKLIAARARLMQSLPAGGVMAAVFAGPAAVTAALEPYAGRISVAAFNGPENVVISGDEEAVDELLARLDQAGTRSKKLATSHAFHSHRMDSILAELRHAAAAVKTAPPELDVIANLYGRVADRHTYADPDYWARHAREPVRFAEGIAALVDSGCEIFLEIGPSPVLIGMGRRCVAESPAAWLPSLRPGRDDWQTVLDSLAQMYVRGVRVDWAGFDEGYGRRRTVLPNYPFQRRRYWSATAWVPTVSGPVPGMRGSQELHPLLGRRLVAGVNDRIFESQVAANRPAMLGDHKIQNVVIMPGSAYLEMALAASAALHAQPWVVCAAALVEPLILDKTSRTLQTIVTPEGPSAAAFRVVSVTQSDDNAEPTFTTHAVGRLENPPAAAPATIDLAARRAEFTGEARDDAWRMEALRKSGIQPGPTFSWTPQHWVHQREALAEMRPETENDHAADYQIHPGLLDSAFQLLGAALPGAGEGIDTYVPMGIDRLQLFQRPSGPTWLSGRLTSLEGNVALGDVQLLNPAGHVLMKISGVRLRRVPRNWLARLVAGPLPNWRYELTWTTQPLEPAAEKETAPQEAAAAPGCWLVFDTAGHLGAELAERLKSPGQSCTLVSAGADGAARIQAVEQFLAEGPSPARGVVYLSGMDVDRHPAAPVGGNGQAGEGTLHPATDVSCEPDFAAARECGWGGVLDVVHALNKGGEANPPRLWIVTRGAQAAGERPRPLALGQSAVWGLGRVIAAEHPELACTRIDLDAADDGAVEQLAAEITSASREDQVAFRDGQRRVARLHRLGRGAAGQLEQPRGKPYRLEITTRGQLDNVALRPVERVQPGPGQIEIEVRATGLNFRDVLNVLNLYPGDPGPLGGECAGVIAAVGPGVEHLKLGDAVFGLAPASFANYVVTLADFVAPKPEHMSFEEAATIPICFLTAHLALRRLGHMQPGQRVLIHAASGGVGLAAIQIARRLGLEIFATAGSPRKRQYLQELGIQHVFDSRSHEFAAQINAVLGEPGIDLVVNSLTGESIAASLSTMRAGGRFMELGKTDLWDQKRVDEFRPGVTFFPIALDHMMAQEPGTVRELMAEILPEFVQRCLQSLPLRAYGITHVVEAFRHMARAEHIGKVVIQSAPIPPEETDEGLKLRDDGAYLLTGGLGGLGLKTARWLADHGARHLVLVGRSEPTPEAAKKIEELRSGGVEVVVHRGDVGRRDDVAAVLAHVAAEMPPLRGVFHLAGVLDDGVLREQTRERFDRVMSAKMLGAWHLHDLTRDLPLEQFVLFSSAAALMGSPGQGNYASANAFLDALAHHRRWEKRPALSVNWGSWAEVGMAAKLKETEGRRWAAAGVGWIEPDRGMETLELLLRDGRPQAGVLPIDWPKFFERIPAGSEPGWLVELAREARSAAPAAESGPPVLLDKLNEVTPGERLDVAQTHIRQQAARVLAMAEGELPDPRRPLNELGFDSLTAVEFCNRVGRAIGQHLNPTLLFDYPTLELLAGYVVRDVLHLDTQATAAAAPSEPSAAEAAAAVAAGDDIQQQAAEDVEGMSEADMDALVAQQLEKLQS